MLSLKKPNIYFNFILKKKQDNVKALEKELRNLFQLWSKNIENRDVDSIDCGIAFEDRVYFEDKINESLNSLNFEMLEVGLVEGEKQELKLLVKELEQFLIELVENFENYNNHLIESPHQNIFDGLSDFPVDETSVYDLIENIFDVVSDFSDDKMSFYGLIETIFDDFTDSSDDEMSVDDLSENIFDDVSDFSDEEAEDDDSDEIIRHRIIHHRIVFYDSDGEIEDDDVNINTLIKRIV